MERCLELACQGLGQVSPNPLVGCVVVHEGKIIGEGYHPVFGGPHAEVNAIGEVKDKDLLKCSTLYVNLEPCSHFGKTPPCTDLILQHDLAKVVVATPDPNPLVHRKGLKILRDKHVEVIEGVMADEARWLNRRFFTFHEEKRPYIILKWAQTSDGYIDVVPSGHGSRNDYWITNDILKRLVHKWRSEEDAIMVGTATAMNDDPALTVRDWSGRNPLRIVIDKNLILPPDLSLLGPSAKTIVFTEMEKQSFERVTHVRLDFTMNILPQAMKVLYESGIQSLIVEGGKTLLSSFIELGLWDEARVLEGSRVYGKGVPAPRLSGTIFREKTFSGDKVTWIRNP